MPKERDLVERLERLERVNRRFRTGLAIVVSGAIAVAIVATTLRQDTSEAKRFVLRDEAGKVRAELCSTAAGPAFVFFDSAGIERARLQVNDDGNTALNLNNGLERAIELRTGSDGWSSLVFSGAEARKRFFLGLAYDGEPRLRMYSQQGRSRVGLGSDMCGRVDLVIHDASGQERAVLRSAPNGAPTLTLYDDEGRKSFTAP